MDLGLRQLLLFSECPVTFYRCLGMESPYDRPSRADDSYRTGFCSGRSSRHAIPRLQSGVFCCPFIARPIYQKEGLHRGTIFVIASIWLGLAVASSIIAYHLRISIALVEICVGVAAGAVAASLGKAEALGSNLEWLRFLASSGAVLLTFLAGAELEPEVIKAKLREVSVVGLVGFFGPFLGCRRWRVTPSGGISRRVSFAASRCPRPPWPWSMP